MNLKGDGLAFGPEKLLAWWGANGGNGFGDFESRFKRLQEFASEQQTASAEAAAHEIGALFETRERFVESMRELMQSKQPEDILAAQAGLAASYFHVLSEQAKRWATFAEKAHTYCAELAHDKAHTSAKRAKNEAEGKHAPRAVHPRETAQHAAE